MLDSFINSWRAPNLRPATPPLLLGFEATALHDSASLKKQSHSAEPAAQPRSEQGEG
jgi:hypothetical protein